MANLKVYCVKIPAEAKGHQFWTVKASSQEEAIKIIKDGGGEFYAEEMDVQSLDYHNAQAALNE